MTKCMKYDLSARIAGMKYEVLDIVCGYYYGSVSKVMFDKFFRDNGVERVNVNSDQNDVKEGIKVTCFTDRVGGCTISNDKQATEILSNMIYGVLPYGYTLNISIEEKCLLSKPA